MQARRDLVFVSAGLDLDGGGRALAGRLLARTCADLAREWGIGFEVLALGRSGSPVNARYFGARKQALALAAWQRQLRSRRTALVFDLLGPARTQAWLPNGLRAPYLVFLHGIEVWGDLSRARLRALEKASLRLANSRFTETRTRAKWGDLGDIEIVPLCLEERPPAGKVDRELLDRIGEGFLLIVGRMASGERYKGHDALLAAMPRLLEAHPGARLVVAGEGDDRLRLEARSAALGLHGRVHFTGFVSEASLAELYRRCAVFVMPSLGEGFGLVYLEAMRAGKPCVAARGSAAEELVSHGSTGLLVAQNEEEVAAALDTLLGQPELALRMGDAGRNRWQVEFKEERFRERLRPLIERLVT